MGRTACTEPQCLYKGALYLTSVPVQGCTLPSFFLLLPLFFFTNKNFSASSRMRYSTNKNIDVQSLSRLSCSVPYHREKGKHERSYRIHYKCSNPQAEERIILYITFRRPLGSNQSLSQWVPRNFSQISSGSLLNLMSRLHLYARLGKSGAYI